MHRNSSIYISILEHKNCKNVNVAIVALDNFFQPYFYALLSFLCTSDSKMNLFLLGIQVVVYYVLICYKRFLVCNDKKKSFKKSRNVHTIGRKYALIAMLLADYFRSVVVLYCKSHNGKNEKHSDEICDISV